MLQGGKYYVVKFGTSDSSCFRKVGARYTPLKQTENLRLVECPRCFLAMWLLNFADCYTEESGRMGMASFSAYMFFDMSVCTRYGAVSRGASFVQRSCLRECGMLVVSSCGV